MKQDLIKSWIYPYFITYKFNPKLNISTDMHVTKVAPQNHLGDVQIKSVTCQKTTLED